MVAVFLNNGRIILGPQPVQSGVTVDYSMTAEQCAALTLKLVGFAGKFLNLMHKPADDSQGRCSCGVGHTTIPGHILLVSQTRLLQQPVELKHLLTATSESQSKTCQVSTWCLSHSALRFNRMGHRQTDCVLQLACRNDCCQYVLMPHTMTPVSHSPVNSWYSAQM